MKRLTLALALAAAFAAPAYAENLLVGPGSFVTDSSAAPPPPGLPPPDGLGAPLGMPVDDNVVVTTSGTLASQDIWHTAVFGPGSYASDSLRSTAIGADATVRGSLFSAALGSGASVWQADSSVALTASGGGVWKSASSIAIGYNASASGADQTVHYDNVAIGSGARVEWGTIGATAFGAGALVQGPGYYNPDLSFRSPTLNGMAFGTGAQVLGDSPNSIAFGANARVSNASNSVALGSGTWTSESNVIAVGNRRVTQVSAGTSWSDAVNMSQFDALTAQVSALSAGAGGGGASPAGSFVQLDPGAYHTVVGSHWAGYSVSDSGLQVYGNLDVTGGQIQHIADGVAADDAASVGQVDRAITAAVSPLASQLGGLESSVSSLGASVTALDQRVSAVESKLSGGIAAAAALAQPVSFGEGHAQAVTAGVASYNGAHAVAAAYNRIIANGSKRILFSAGGSVTSRGDALARVGGSLSW